VIPDFNQKRTLIPFAIGKLPTSQAGLESLAVGGEDRGRHLSQFPIMALRALLKTTFSCE
jgi:hypothetical protein